MASNALSDITDEFLVCQICFEDFRQPKMLPCLHTFCQPCLEKLLAAEPVGKLDCPTCRQDVPLPQNGVQGLPSNFLVGKLRDIMQQQPTGKMDGVPCTVCEADLQSGQAAAELRARETSKCEDHRELNKFYCDTCQRVISLHCVVTAHKEHQYVEIEKASEREGGKIKAKVTTVKNTVGLHETWRQQLQSVRDEWPSEVQRTEEQVRKQVKAIIEAAEKAGDDRIGQLLAMNAAREKQMDAAMEAAEMDLASARSCVQFADNVLEYGSPAEVISVAAELTGRLDRTAEDKSAERAELTMNFVKLPFAPPAGGLLEKVVKLVGGIKQVRTPLIPPTLQVRPNVAIGNGGVSLEHVKTVGEEGSGDGQFHFPSSLAAAAEGDIVVADHYNSRLQFLDKEGCFKKKVDLGFEPECVAALTNGELLVTGDGHKIHVLDKQGRKSRVIQVTGAAELGRAARGIAVDGSGRIIVTIRHQVFVLSPSGDVMLKFGDKGEGQQQLGSFLRVTVNSSNQIIVSDRNNHNLKIFDSAGRHLFTRGSYGWGPDQLDGPSYVITDSEDNIIVAEFGIGRVSLFSRDGAFIRHVLTREEHVLACPLGLTLTHDRQLVVSEGSGSIKFFQVK
ncbi:tripartite motif-containing protein 2-like [Branchiostoma floridae x Branchiostoma belcheri]